MKFVNFTTSKFKLFRDAYEQALVNGQERFRFEGDEYVMDYAKYLIEYLSEKFEE